MTEKHAPKFQNYSLNTKFFWFKKIEKFIIGIYTCKYRYIFLDKIIDHTIDYVLK